MEVTKLEMIESEESIEIPEPWMPAWREPEGEPVTSFDWSVIRVHTADGIVGIGPAVGAPQNVELDELDPNQVGKFWTQHLSGKRAGNDSNVAGVEIALWDAFGKSVGKPVHKLLGGVRDRVPVYAATSRLLDPDALVDQVLEIKDRGFSAVKLRLHRSDPQKDLEAVRAVRKAVGKEYTIMVDANQNNSSSEYDFWSRRTARRMAHELDKLDIAFLEEPLPQKDVTGLAELQDQVNMAIAGGEHSKTIYDFKGHLQEGAYDILQPDVLMDGHMGIIGIYRTAILADFFDRTVIPHVIGNANLAVGLAATLQAAGAAEGVAMVEYPYDPPILTEQKLQPLAKKPLWIDENSEIEIPDGPGLGIEFDQGEIHTNGNIVWSVESL